jgi:Rod binding domain-containing protein
MRLHDNAPSTTLPTNTTSTRLQSHTALKKTTSKEEQAAQEAADNDKVSEGVESMFVRQMLEASHMFDGVGGHPMMQGMMLEKLSDAVVKGGHLGIGDYVTGQQHGAQPGGDGPSRTVHGPQSAATRSHAKPTDDDSMIGSVDELALMHASSKTMATAKAKHADFGMPDMDMDMGMSIDVGDFALPDDLLPKAAKDAVDEGRVQGLGRGASVEQALGRSWTPIAGAPQDDTGVIPLAQADSNATLGTGPKTIRQAGCLLTSMTMVSNTLTGARNGVDAANQIVTTSGGFDGNNMKVDVAAQALGLQLGSRSAFTGDTSAIDASLARGRPVVVGVDFKDGSSSSLGRTDHFLVVTGRAPGGGYTAVDAANGRSLAFARDGQGALRAGKYDLAEVVTLEPSAATNAATLARAARVRAARFGGDAFAFAGFDG